MVVTPPIDDAMGEDVFGLVGEVCLNRWAWSMRLMSGWVISVRVICFEERHVKH